MQTAENKQARVCKSMPYVFHNNLKENQSVEEGKFLWEEERTTGNGIKTGNDIIAGNNRVLNFFFFFMLALLRRASF